MIPKSFTGRHVPNAAEKEEANLLQGVDKKESVSGVVATLVQYLAERNRLPKLADLPSKGTHYCIAQRLFIVSITATNTT